MHKTANYAPRPDPAGRAQDYQSRGAPASPHRTRVSARTLPALCPDSPRLLGLEMAARYLGVSYSVFRRWVFAGEIRAVRLPSSRRPGRESRRVYVDRADLDRFVEQHKG